MLLYVLATAPGHVHTQPLLSSLIIQVLVEVIHHARCCLAHSKLWCCLHDDVGDLHLSPGIEVFHVLCCACQAPLADLKICVSACLLKPSPAQPSQAQLSPAQLSPSPARSGVCGRAPHDLGSPSLFVSPGALQDGAGCPTGTPLADPALVEAISEDPILRNTKLIAEAWDCDGLNQVCGT